MRLFKGRMRGQGLTAYALVLILVALVVIAALALFGASIKSTYCRIIEVLPFDGSTCDAVAMVYPKGTAVQAWILPDSTLNLIGL